MTVELEKLLTPEQLADWLGVKLGWVYRHAAPGCAPEQRLPSIKVGRLLRFSPHEIDDWKRANGWRRADASEGPNAVPAIAAAYQDVRQNTDSRAEERPSDDSDAGLMRNPRRNGHEGHV